MKASEVQLWKPFVNNSGHLSIAYKKSNSRLFIINYNGTIYDVAINNSCSQTDYKDTHITAEQFFSDFPLIIFKDDYRNKRLDTFYQILKTFARFQTLKMFLNLSEQNNKLLLII